MWIVARLLAVIFLVLALGDNDYGYYTLLRWVVCGVATYSFFTLKKLSRELKAEDYWSWLFGAIALFFNPFVPVNLGREIWSLVDVSVAIIFVISIFVLRNKKGSKTTST